MKSVVIPGSPTASSCFLVLGNQITEQLSRIHHKYYLRNCVYNVTDYLSIILQFFQLSRFAVRYVCCCVCLILCYHTGKIYVVFYAGVMSRQYVLIRVFKNRVQLVKFKTFSSMFNH